MGARLTKEENFADKHEKQAQPCAEIALDHCTHTIKRSFFCVEDCLAEGQDPAARGSHGMPLDYEMQTVTLDSEVPMEDFNEFILSPTYSKGLVKSMHISSQEESINNNTEDAVKSWFELTLEESLDARSEADLVHQKSDELNEHNGVFHEVVDGSHDLTPLNPGNGSQAMPSFIGPFCFVPGCDTSALENLRNGCSQGVSKSEPSVCIIPSMPGCDVSLLEEYRHRPQRSVTYFEV